MPPLTSQAAAAPKVRTATKDATRRPLRQRDVNVMGEAPMPSNTGKEPVWKSSARSPTLQRSATTWQQPRSWRATPPSHQESSSMGRPLSQVMQPSAPRVSEDRMNVSPPAENRVRTGAAVYRSHSLRSYFRPPEPLTRQPSLAAGRSHETSRKPISYTLDGDDLEAVLKKGLEAVKRRQMPIQSEHTTALSEPPGPSQRSAQPPQSTPLGQRPLYQLASPSYMHAAPPCRNLNAERRPEVRHASHHYAPQLLQSQCAEIYVLR